MNNEQPTVPVEITPSERVSGGVQPRVEKQHWLRRILAYVRQIKCLRQCDDESPIFVNVAVDSNRKVLRGPDPLAIATHVSNLGDSDLSLYEGDVYIGELLARQNRELFLGGKLEISAQTSAGESTTIMLATYRRCECGEEVDEVYQSGESTPITPDLV